MIETKATAAATTNDPMADWIDDLERQGHELSLTTNGPDYSVTFVTHLADARHAHRFGNLESARRFMRLAGDVIYTTTETRRVHPMERRCTVCNRPGSWHGMTGMKAKTQAMYCFDHFEPHGARLGGMLIGTSKSPSFTAEDVAAIRAAMGSYL